MASVGAWFSLGSWGMTAANAYQTVTGYLGGRWKVEKHWAPEVVAFIVELAMLSFSPHGTKLCFAIHGVELHKKEGLGAWQWVWRRCTFEGKRDLYKIPEGVVAALSLLPPQPVPDDIEMNSFNVKDVLQRNEIPALTRIYLCALHGLKKLANTYGIKNPDEAPQLKDEKDVQYLKLSITHLKSGLRGVKFEDPVSEVGEWDVKVNWKPCDFEFIAERLKEAAYGVFTQLDPVTSLLNSKIKAYQDHCNEMMQPTKMKLTLSTAPARSSSSSSSSQAAPVDHEKDSDS